MTTLTHPKDEPETIDPDGKADDDNTVACETEVPAASVDYEAALSAVAEASAALLDQPNAAKVLPRVLDLAAKILAADAHAVWLKDPRDGHWSVATSRGLSRAYVESATRMIAGAGDDVISLDKPSVAEDIETVPWLAANRDAHRAEGNRSLLVAPLSTAAAVAGNGRRSLFGTVAFYYRTPRKFSSGDISAAQALANLAASAIRTSHLYDEEQKALRAAEQQLAERHRAEEDLRAREQALKESEARYRSIVETAQEGIWMVDSDFRTTFVNARMAEMLGCKAEDIVGRPAEDFMDEVDQLDFQERRRHRMTGQGEQYDARFRRADGEALWAIVSSGPLLDASGHVSGAVALLTDITERKRWEVDRARLAAIVDTSYDAIVSKDLNGIVTSWNAAAERIYGWKAEEIIGKSKNLVIPPDLPDELPSILAKIRAGQRIAHYDTRRVRKDGTPFEVSVAVSPIMDASGRIVGASTIARDTTERNQTARELQRRQAEVEGLNERLKQAMRETHHRVKNNLQVIAAMVDLQVMDQPFGRTVPMSELTRLGTHIRTLAAVHDVLTKYLREEEEDQLLSTRTVFERLIPLLEQTAGNRSIHARVDDACLTGKQATSLALVANELVSNAVKHGEGPITVLLEAGENLVTLTVRNGGSGFPPDFDPELSANTGLQLVTAMAETDLSAFVRFSNIPGGAEVCVTVPLPPAAKTNPLSHTSEES